MDFTCSEIRIQQKSPRCVDAFGADVFRAFCSAALDAFFALKLN